MTEPLSMQQMIDGWTKCKVRAERMEENCCHLLCADEASALLTRLRELRAEMRTESDADWAGQPPTDSCKYFAERLASILGPQK